MSFFQGASNVKISGGTFMSVSNSGTLTNNIGSNNISDSYNTQSTAISDSYNNNARQYSGSNLRIGNDNPPPPRGHPPSPPQSDWARRGAQHGGSFGYGNGYPPPPPHGGQTYNSYNTSNETYDGSFNDNSRRYGAPGDRGPNMNRRPERPVDEDWMAGDRDALMGGPSRTPTAGARRQGPPSPNPPYDRSPQGFQGRPRARMNIPDVHINNGVGGRVSVENANITSMSPDMQQHFESLMDSLQKEVTADSDESEPEDKRMGGSAPPKTLSAGIANMSLDDAGKRSGPSRAQARSAPPGLDDRDEDEDMDAAPQMQHSTSQSDIPKAKKKSPRKREAKRNAPTSPTNQDDYWNQHPSYAGHGGYAGGYPSYGGPSPQFGRGGGMQYSPHPPPPPGHYGRGGPYDPHFQQRYPYDDGYGYQRPYSGPDYAAPPMGYGSGNIHNVRMTNAYNDNSRVEYHEEGHHDDDDEESDEEGGDDDQNDAQPEKLRPKEKERKSGAAQNNSPAAKGAPIPVAIE